MHYSGVPICIALQKNLFQVKSASTALWKQSFIGHVLEDTIIFIAFYCGFLLLECIHSLFEGLSDFQDTKGQPLINIHWSPVQKCRALSSSIMWLSWKREISPISWLEDPIEPKGDYFMHYFFYFIIHCVVHEEHAVYLRIGILTESIIDFACFLMIFLIGVMRQIIFFSSL